MNETAGFNASPENSTLMMQSGKRNWRAFWVRHSGVSIAGRWSARIASLGLAPFHRRASLACLSPSGFVDAEAHLDHPKLILGKNIYLGKGVVVSECNHGGPIWISDHVRIYGMTFLETGQGGTISIGDHTHLQPGCHIHSHRSSLVIGEKVEIAAQCAFYNYNHGMDPSLPVMDQPIRSRGGIHIDDGAWIGHGVTVLEGVRIGKGAVIAAGSVVSRDVPDHAIAAGIPARVIRHRDRTAKPSAAKSGTNAGYQAAELINQS
jgi:acetyltransferase-like isoleucine patch superfamily enzyme